MRPEATTCLSAMPRSREGIRRAVAGVQLLLFVLVVLLATFPDLHHLLHGDADDEDHDCAVTLLLRGSVDLADTRVEPAPVARVEWPHLANAFSYRATRHDDAFQARGPPVG